jgi:hypothetical protein
VPKQPGVEVAEGGPVLEEDVGGVLGLVGGPGVALAREQIPEERIDPARECVEARRPLQDGEAIREALGAGGIRWRGAGPRGRGRGRGARWVARDRWLAPPMFATACTVPVALDERSQTLPPHIPGKLIHEGIRRSIRVGRADRDRPRPSAQTHEHQHQTHVSYTPPEAGGAAPVAD